MESLNVTEDTLVLNVTEQTMKKSGTEKGMTIAMAIFIFLAIVGIIGNSITIFALGKSKKLRNATTAFIINLCIADLLYCAFTFAISMQPNWNKNPVFCRWFPLVRYIVAGESVYVLVAITINRYVCIVHPSKYRALYRPKALFMMILITWLYAMMLCLLPFFQIWGVYGYDPKVGMCTVLKLNGTSPKDYMFITAFAFPTIAFSICYPRIFWTVHQASKRIRKQSVFKSPAALNTNAYKPNVGDLEDISPLPVKTDSEREHEREIRVLKVMCVVVIAFVICYFPIVSIKIFELEGKVPALTVLAYLGVNLSNVINPIIYVAMSKEYRTAYTEIFCYKKLKLYLTSSSESELIEK